MTHPLNHILLVDDELAILQVAKIALEKVGGFRVDTCESGKEAITRAAELKPEMILLDVMMPGMDGPTTYATLRAFPALKETCFIFMTARVQPKEVASYLGLGAIGVVMKPFDPMTLSDEIRAFWNEFHSRR